MIYIYSKDITSISGILFYLDHVVLRLGQNNKRCYPKGQQRLLYSVMPNLFYRI